MTSPHPAEGTRMLAWHLASGLMLLLLLPLLLGEPVWGMPRAELLPFGLLLLGYGVSGLVPVVACWRGERLTTLQVLLAVTAVFGVVFLGFLLARWSLPRTLLAGVYGAALLVIPVINARPRGLAPVLPLAGLFLGAGLLSLGRESSVPPFSPRKTALIRTAFYNLQVDFHSGVIPRPRHAGGGLARIGNRFLLMTGDGLFYLLSWSGIADSLSVRPLPYRVPANLPELAEAVGLSEATSTASGTARRAAFWFRGALGMRAGMQGDSLEVQASYLFWVGDRQCVVERVAMLKAPIAEFLEGAPAPQWRLLYQTAPCLPLHGSKRPEEWLHDGSYPFSGHAAGGRLIRAGGDSLLLSVGDFDYDGVTIPGPPVSQDPSGSYGKTILIRLNGGNPEVFSSGHRNPQGLLRDGEGSIWLTEHGPQGGDELNLIVPGANYGWPLVTYGSEYGSSEWPLSRRQGRHEGFQTPVYAWVPSIAVSDLIRIESGRYPAWQGDLLIGTLGMLELHRVRISGPRVIHTERFKVGRQIRALVEGEDGRIVLWTDDFSVGSITPNRGETGEALFALRCGACHTAGESTEYRIGPDLRGIVGRPVASAPAGFLYSPALRALDGTWTAVRLDGFIANPRSVAPGNRMRYSGLDHPTERAAIIQYLRSRR